MTKTKILVKTSTFCIVFFSVYARATNGNSVPKDLDQWVQNSKIQCQAGIVSDCIKLGMFYQRHGHFKKGCTLIEEHCQKGAAAACFQMVDVFKNQYLFDQHRKRISEKPYLDRACKLESQNPLCVGFETSAPAATSISVPSQATPSQVSPIGKMKESGLSKPKSLIASKPDPLTSPMSSLNQGDLVPWKSLCAIVTEPKDEEEFCTTLTECEEKIKAYKMNIDGSNTEPLRIGKSCQKLSKNELQKWKKSAQVNEEEMLLLTNQKADTSPCLQAGFLQAHKGNRKEGIKRLQELCQKLEGTACEFLSRLEPRREEEYLKMACQITEHWDSESSGDEGHDYGEEYHEGGLKLCSNDEGGNCLGEPLSAAEILNEYGCKNGSASACVAKKDYEAACKLQNPLACSMVGKTIQALRFAQQQCENSKSYKLSTLQEDCSKDQSTACSRLNELINTWRSKSLLPLNKVLCEVGQKPRVPSACLVLAEAHDRIEEFQTAQNYRLQGCAQADFAGCEKMEVSKEGLER